MDFEAVGKSALFWGAVSVGVGAIIVSASWFLLGFYKQTSEWLAKHAFKIANQSITVIVLLAAILIGSILIAWGGTRTTKGWNALDNHEQRNNLVRAVVQEWLTNRAHLASPPMRVETHYKKKDGGYARFFFPVLTTHSLNAVLSSGLWNYVNQTDNDFLLALVNYEMKVTYANCEFRRHDDDISEIKDPMESITQIEKARTDINESDWFKSLSDWQHKVGKLIWSRYRWAIEAQGFEVYESLRQEFQEKSTANEPVEVPMSGK